MCLMTTHFHLVLFQQQPDAMRRFMQSVLTGYGRYYRDKYGTSGALYNGPFRSRHLKNYKESRWAIGYVHDNHPSGANYRYSTHAAYLDDHKRPGWLAVELGLEAFDGVSNYVQYMRDRSTRADLNANFF